MSKQSEHNGPLGDKFDDFQFEPGESTWDSIESSLRVDEHSAPLSEMFATDVAPVSVDVWPEIEKELHPEKKRRFIYWWTGVAAGLVAVVLLFNVSSSSDNNVLVFNEITTHEKSIKFEIKPHKFLIKESIRTDDKELIDFSAEKNIKSNHFVNNSNSLQSTVVRDEIATSNVFQDSYSAEEFYKLSLDKKADIKLSLELEGILPIKSTNISDLLSLINEKKEQPLNLLKFGVSPLIGFSNAQKEPLLANNASSNSSGYIDVNNSGNVVSSYSDPYLLTLPNVFTPVSSLSFTPNSQVAYNESKQYSQPIGVGASFSYSINSKLSISSGLEYTSTRYSFDEGYWKAFQRTGTKGYLGIPVTFNYNVINNERFQLYPLLGTKVYTEIYGKESYVYETSTNGVVLEEVSVRNSNLGISGSIGIGTQVQLYKKLQFYLQASSEYALKAHKDSYWNDNPLSLSLQAGFSIKL